MVITVEQHVRVEMCLNDEDAGSVVAQQAQSSAVRSVQHHEMLAYLHQIYAFASRASRAMCAMIPAFEYGWLFFVAPDVVVSAKSIPTYVMMVMMVACTLF